MKRAVYILLFVIFGVLLSIIIHSFVELTVISLLLKDFDRYSLGLSWPQWFTLHHILAFVLVAIGVVFGWLQGRFWWRAIYEEHRFKSWLHRSLPSSMSRHDIHDK